MFLFITTIINIIVPMPGNSVVTPAVSFFTEPKQAIALVGFYLAISGVVRMIMFRQHISWTLAKDLLPASIFGVLIGSLSLLSISETIALVVIVVSSSFFLYKKIENKKEKKKGTKFTALIVGTFSGFLQSVGLSGSDIRSNFLYSKSDDLMSVRGTTAVLGTTNFGLATIIKLFTNQITIPNLLPVIYLVPILILGTYIGKKILFKIPTKIQRYIIIATLSISILLGGIKLYQII